MLDQNVQSVPKSCEKSIGKKNSMQTHTPNVYKGEVHQEYHETLQKVTLGNRDQRGDDDMKKPFLENDCFLTSVIISTHY